MRDSDRRKVDGAWLGHGSTLVVWISTIELACCGISDRLGGHDRFRDKKVLLKVALMSWKKGRSNRKWETVSSSTCSEKNLSKK